MAIVRSKRKRNNFSVIDNTGLRDPSLSWKATGLLAFLMTKPDDWEVNLENLTHSKEDGRDSTITALKDLKEAGYVYHKRYRVKGKFESEYLVFETKEDLQEWLDDQGGHDAPQRENHNGKTATEKPLRENHDGKTATENPTQLINKEVITEVLITEELITHSQRENCECEEIKVGCEIIEIEPKALESEPLSVAPENPDKASTGKPKVFHEDRSSAPIRVDSNRYYKRSQSQYSNNADASERLPWETDKKGVFDPDFERQVARSIAGYTSFKDLPLGEFLVRVRKHISAGKYDLKRRDELQIEWDAMHSMPSEGASSVTVSALKQGLRFAKLFGVSQ